jgi:hypothetical protein
MARDRRTALETTRLDDQGARAGQDHRAAVQNGLKGLSYAEGRETLSPSGSARDGEPDPLAGLTPSQRRYVENLLAVEEANPDASPNDVAMAISLLLWGGRLWEQNGDAASVTQVAGVPLVLDYAGGDGYQDVELGDKQQAFFHKQREVYDARQRQSGVAHTFPAVAAQAGREGSAAAAYNTHMVTKGGDFIQDMGRVIVEQKLDGVFREPEQRDNNRALEISKQIATRSRPLSQLLLEQFHRENHERIAKK